jgi:hypothetical protein
MDILLHIANVFLLISFSAKSMLWLRALNIVAGAFFIAWALTFPEPLWASIAWNLLFAMVNVWRIWLAILERRPPVLSAEEQQLYRRAFGALEPRSFRRLLDVGQWENGLPPSLLVEAGQQPTRIWMVAEGSIEVRRGDDLVRTIVPGDFVGETAFLSRTPMPADVRISQMARFISWSTADLEQFMAGEPQIGATLQRIFGECLVRKLHAA